MHYIVLLSFCSLLLAAAAAQKPKPCVSPYLMSGGFTVMTGDGEFMSSGLISYDVLGQRMRIKSTGLVGNQTIVDQLMLYNQKVYYEIDWTKFTCKKRRLNTDFIPFHVPEDANLMGQVFMGSSSSFGMGVLVNTWYGSFPGNGTYSTLFSEIGCIPMTLSAYTPASGWTTISTFNWVLGNTNPMEYTPPFFCSTAKLEEKERPDTVFDALKSLILKSKIEE